MTFEPRHLLLPQRALSGVHVQTNTVPTPPPPVASDLEHMVYTSQVIVGQNINSFSFTFIGRCLN